VGFERVAVGFASAGDGRGAWIEDVHIACAIDGEYADNVK
jgi:hypothetical protein